MRRRRLFWHLYLSYFGIMLLALLAVSWGAWFSLRGFYYAQTRADLESRARLTAGMVAGRLSGENIDFIDARCKELGKAAATRVTVILPSGRVIGDSDHDPATMDNHRNRPEVRRALDGQAGMVVRESATLREPMMYVATPVIEDGHMRGVVRAAIPLTAYNGALNLLKAHLALVVLAIALLSALVSLVISRNISRPLEEARGAAQRFAGGDLQRRVPVGGSREQAGLAEAMNAMATELDARIRAISRQQAWRNTCRSLSDMVLSVCLVGACPSTATMRMSIAWVMVASGSAASRFSRCPSRCTKVTVCPEPGSAQVNSRSPGYGVTDRSSRLMGTWLVARQVGFGQLSVRLTSSPSETWRSFTSMKSRSPASRPSTSSSTTSVLSPNRTRQLRSTWLRPSPERISRRFVSSSSSTPVSSRSSQSRPLGNVNGYMALPS